MNPSYFSLTQKFLYYLQGILADIPRLVTLWRLRADALRLLNRHLMLVSWLAVKVCGVVTPAGREVSVVLWVGDDQACP